ncbi:DapH/DapD/GlmU-related protein [Mesorhizobium sp. A623]
MAGVQGQGQLPPRLARAVDDHCGPLQHQLARRRPEQPFCGEAAADDGAIVDHEVEVGDFAHIGPGVTIGGAARIGSGVLLGAGANILPGVTIGENAVVGAGAVVLEDVPADAVYVGVPARRIR